LITIIVGGVFSALAIHLLLWTRKQRVLALASVHWPRVPAKVLTSSITLARQHHDESDHLSFSYGFKVRSYTYTGDTINLFEKENLMSLEDMQAFIEAHPVGSTVEIQYNPDSPQQCAVHAGNLDGYQNYRRLAYLCLGMGILLLGIAVKSAL
jgi:hypothetical protein